MAFRVGIAAPTVNMLPLWVGAMRGLFKARGLDVQIVNTDGGSRGLAEVGAGRAAGDDCRAFRGDRCERQRRRLPADRVRRQHHELPILSERTESAVLPSLSGKKVGVSAFGSESDSAATMALKQLGLIASDVQIVEAGGTLNAPRGAEIRRARSDAL